MGCGPIQWTQAGRRCQRCHGRVSCIFASARHPRGGSGTRARRPVPDAGSRVGCIHESIHGMGCGGGASFHCAWLGAVAQRDSPPSASQHGPWQTFVPGCLLAIHPSPSTHWRRPPGHRWIAHSGRPLDAADRAPGRPQGPIHSACSGAASPPQGRPPQWVVHGTLQLRLSSSCLSSGAASTPTSPKPANHSRRKIFVLAKAGRPWSVGSDS